MTALPSFWELDAQPGWRCIDFLSDLHLSEATPKTFQAFAQHLASTPADAVFLLGDIFEAWIGDDARFDGFEARAAEVLAEASSHRTIGFMHGNRDFLLGHEMLSACGVMALADPTVVAAFGERILLTHGDALCLSDLAYQRFRAQVRQPEWQRAMLARPLAERRAIAQAMRAESSRQQAGYEPDAHADADFALMARWMHEAGTPTLVHGHTHRPGQEPIAPGFMRYVLSDWDFEGETPRGDVLRWTRAGLKRVPPGSD